MEIIHDTQLMVAKTSVGHSKFWQGVVATDGIDYFTYTVAYQEKMPGVQMSRIQSTPKRIVGKNIGRANETTPHDQAISEIESNAARKYDKGYRAVGSEPVEERPLPMLAHNYEKRGHNIDWPCYVQPKLDGVRMLFDGVKGWSRGGKDFIPEVIAHLQCDLPKGVILDGELMLSHEDYTFQETMRTIKKYRGPEHPKLEYHVYDLVGSDTPFDIRLEGLRVLEDNLPAYIRPVATIAIRAESEMHDWHGKWTASGFEGIILRNTVGHYTPGHRSKDLQKYKHFQDAEFKVIGFQDGVAKERGCIIYICEAEGGPFKVRPRGTVSERQEMFRKATMNPDAVLGRLLTVRFQEYSDDRIPRFPVGIALREAWDA